ncbi:hypothetical protein COV06_03590 [Candidatus Uhrbacteria bacterium CG10_big_fil_rev_8_21_14_0_10_50_16]|uniref:Ribulose-phosphate 3-epimerase n=1 Tax=Candidatus Uhrbacteria bacterium CG10_big_fil_rev_8_21_14_0_10_50_16 TaxID=1975039 RepID=A0A2H0RM40_9BACT|nr:MAG: hypothetical protein COV06_03590 [Candidatus Uhrbacteria bacterium CG10_big_fil_rev_8_21_14_0_10_50_16]
MAIILPAILVQTAQEFEEHINLLPEDVDTVSVDIMDGTFVETSSFRDANTIRNIDTFMQYELDLMVDDPLPIIEAWAKLPQTIRAIVHAELKTDMRVLLQEIKKHKLEVGIALLPQTRIADIEHLLNEVDMVLIRGNEPGYSGRAFNPLMLEKVRELEQDYPHLLINVDIGVNAETIPEIIEAGATHLSVNSAIFKQSDPLVALRDLQRLARP